MDIEKQITGFLGSATADPSPQVLLIARRIVSIYVKFPTLPERRRAVLVPTALGDGLAAPSTRPEIFSMTAWESGLSLKSIKRRPV
jgi:hypothetical protein